MPPKNPPVPGRKVGRPRKNKAQDVKKPAPIQSRSHFHDSDSDESELSFNANAPLRSSQTLLGSHNTLKQLLSGPPSQTTHTPTRKALRKAPRDSTDSPITSASTPISRLKQAKAQLESPDNWRRSSIHFDDIEAEPQVVKRGRPPKKTDPRKGKAVPKPRKRQSDATSTPSKRAASSRKAKTTTDYAETTSQHMLDLTDDSELAPNRRRSSYNNRGKRVSSIGNGFVAGPHSEVSEKEYYKSLDPSMPDPNRMRQLLTWCYRKSLEKESDDASSGKDEAAKGKDSETAKGIAKIIKQEILEDLSEGFISTSWYSLKDERNEPDTIQGRRIVRPNPLNESNRENIEIFKRKLRDLESEKASWQEAYEAGIKEINGLSVGPTALNMKDLKAYVSEKQLAPDFVNNVLSDSLVTKMQARIDDTSLNIKNNLEVNIDKLRHLSYMLRQSLRLVSKVDQELLSPEVGELVKNFMKRSSTAERKEISAKDLLRGIARLDAKKASV